MNSRKRGIVRLTLRSRYYDRTDNGCAVLLVDGDGV